MLRFASPSERTERIWVQAEGPNHVFSPLRPTIPTQLLMSFNFSLDQEQPENNGLLQTNNKPVVVGGLEAELKPAMKSATVVKTFRYTLDDEFEVGAEIHQTAYQQQVYSIHTFFLVFGYELQCKSNDRFIYNSRLCQCAGVVFSLHLYLHPPTSHHFRCWVQDEKKSVLRQLRIHPVVCHSRNPVGGERFWCNSQFKNYSFL